MRYWIFLFVCLNVASAENSGFSRSGNTLLWDGSPVQLVGYSAFDTVTRNNFDFRRYMNELQFVDGPTGSERHGVNLTRIWAMGWHNAPAGCRTPAEADPSMPLTRMPFKTIGSNCSAKVRFPKYDVTSLDDAYLIRLKEVLRAARDNGVIVQLTLFDHYHLLKELYSTNPWNPINNNMYELGCKILPRSRNRKATDLDSLPGFYDICDDKTTTQSCNATLNCWGKIQKQYVEGIATAVKNSGANDSVFFEVMNETNGGLPAELALWQDVVGSWIKNVSNSLVAASTACGLSEIRACNNEICPNDCRVYQMPNIDIVNLHAAAWIDAGICEVASAVVEQFGKPAIIDTDGLASIPQRNNKCIVKGWAETATSCRAPGQVHFNQLDGMTMRKIRRPCSFNPARDNRNFHESLLDCHTLDAIGDAQPTRLTRIITAEPSASCPHFSSATWCSDVCR